MYYTYLYRDPCRSDEPFYAGKGHGSRSRHHVWNRYNHYNKELGQRIQEIVDENQREVIIEMVPYDDEEQAFEAECKLIEEHGRTDLGTGTLLNKTSGGEGWGKGRTWSEELRQRTMEARRKNPRGIGFTQYDLFGTKLKDFSNAAALREAGFTPSAIASIRVCCNGDRFSSKGFRWSYKDQPLPDASTTRKFVQQHDATTLELLAEFDSISSASKQTGVNAGDIASCVRGNTRMKTAGGYVWVEEGQPLPKIKRIQQICPDTDAVLSVHRSTIKAAESVGIHPTNIQQVLRGQRKTAGGFIWKYA